MAGASAGAVVYDGPRLEGAYHGIGLATRIPISGVMRVQKVPPAWRA
jgi:hypothetical protein